MAPRTAGMQVAPTQTLRRRFDRGTVRRLAPVDVVAVLAFVVAGEFSHGVNVLSYPVYVAGTAIPFLVGWALVGSLAGAYRRDVLASPRNLVLRTVGGWLGADVVAQALRATATFHGDANPVFFAVAGGVGATLLLVGRFAVRAVTAPESG